MKLSHKDIQHIFSLNGGIYMKEATRIKRNVYFLDLVDLALTYLGWCFKVIPFLTDLTLEGHHK